MFYYFKSFWEKIIAFCKKHPAITLSFLILCVGICSLYINNNALGRIIEKERISSFESRISDFSNDKAYKELRLESIEKIKSDEDLDVDVLAKETRKQAFVIALKQLLTDANAIDFLGKKEYIQKVKEEIVFYDTVGYENLDPNFFDRINVERERLFN